MTAKPAAPYLQIVTELGRRIASGELAPGDRVPSTRQVAAEWGVALATAAKALTTLREQGLVCTRPRSGTVVAPIDPVDDGAHHPAMSEGRAGLSSERVVRAAIAIADHEGLDALSMRGVAARLGVAAMSPYRYVTGRDELVLMMTDAAFGELDYPDPPPTEWRARWEVAARALWALYRRHPWLAQLNPPTKPLPLPNMIRHADWAFAALDGLQVDPAAARNLLVLVYSFIQGLAANLDRRTWMEATSPPQDHAQQEILGTALATHAASGRYPAFAKVTRTLHQRGDHLDLDEIFGLGLDTLLDGIAARLPQHAHESDRQ